MGDRSSSGAWLLRVVLLGMVVAAATLAGVSALAASFPSLPLPFLGPAVYWIDPIWWVAVMLALLAIFGGSAFLLLHVLWRFRLATPAAPERAPSARRDRDR